MVRSILGRRVFLCLDVVIVVTILGLVGSCPAEALPEYLQAAKSTYAFKPGGVIDSKGCMLCHAGATNKNSLNPFGKSLQQALARASTKTADPALLHTLDTADPDGDGWPNAAEFRADTLPGDPASKPSGSPPGSVGRTGPTGGDGELQPFSLKSLVYPGHAQHPVIIHFPIALFLFSVLLDLLGLRTKNRVLHTAATYNLIAAAITGIVAVATGLLAWRFAFNGESLLADRWLLFHLILGSVSTLLMCALWAVRARQLRDSNETVGTIYIALSIVTALAIALTGHLGGVVSGVVR